MLRAIAGCSAGKQAEVHLHMIERKTLVGNRCFELQSAAKPSSPSNSAGNFNREEKVVSITGRHNDKPARTTPRNSDL